VKVVIERERERRIVISLVRINNRIIMRKDTGQDSKVGIGIHAFDSGRGRLK